MNNKKKKLPTLPFGMGTIYWRDEDKGIMGYRKMIGEDPYKVRKYVTGKNLKELLDKMNLVEKEHDEADRLKKRKANRSQALGKAMEEWLFMYKHKNIKDKSFDREESTLNNQILKYDIAHKQIQAIDSDDVQRTMKQIAEDGLSFSTQKKAYDLFNQFFRFKYIREPNLNPMLTVTKPKKDATILDEELIVLDDDEIKKFVIEASKPVTVGVGGYSHGLLLISLIWTFMRVGEALALQYKDVDFERKEMHIYKAYSLVKDRSDSVKSKYVWQLTTAKTRSGHRTVDLCENAINSLKEYKERKNSSSEDDFIFTTSGGEPIALSNLSTNLQSILKNAGINKKITLHKLRNTGISFFLRHGVPIEVISRMAGHRDISITSNIYYSVIEQQRKDSIDMINHLKDFQF